MFLVIWTTKVAENEYEDHWMAHDTYNGADEMFKDLQTLDDVYSISICQPVKSTEPHFVMEEV